MPSTTVTGELFSWRHIVQPNAKDLRSVAEDFSLSEMEALILDKGSDLPRLYDRGPWNLLTFHVPDSSMNKHAMAKTTFVILYDKRRVVTLSDRPMAVLSDLVPKGARVPKRFDHGTSTDIVVWILGAVFEGLHDITEDMMEVIRKLERRLLRRHQSDDLTRDIGSLRRDIVMLDLMVEPARIVLDELMKTDQPHRSEAADLQLRALRDRLRGIHVILDHYGSLVDGVSNTHETLLSHYTNRVVQTLTIISVLFLPPTLITSYFGMNSPNLPLVHDFKNITVLIAFAFVLFFFVVYRIRK